MLDSLSSLFDTLQNNELFGIPYLYWAISVFVTVLTSCCLCCICCMKKRRAQQNIERNLTKLQSIEIESNNPHTGNGGNFKRNLSHPTGADATSLQMTTLDPATRKSVMA
eukprot:377334_1